MREAPAGDDLGMTRAVAGNRGKCYEWPFGV